MAALWELVSESVLVIAWSISAAIVGLVLVNRTKIAALSGLVDDPSKKAHARHVGTVPLVGGIAWVCGLYGFVFALSCLSLVFDADLLAETATPSLIAFLLFVGSFFILGLVDDRNGLSPRSRLVLSVAFVASFLLFTGHTFVLDSVGDSFLQIGAHFGHLSGLVTLLAVIALVNALNMTDGRNGIVAGTILVWCFALISKSQDLLLSAILGACALNSVLVLIYNLRGRVFFGDGGTYAIAAAFAGLTLAWHSNTIGGTQLTSLQVCSLFLVPVLDMLRLMVTRIGSGRSPMAADHNHLHHRLDDRFGWPAGLPIYLGLTAAPVFIAFQSFEASGALGVTLGAISYLSVITFTDRPETLPGSAAQGVALETEGSVSSIA